MDLQQKNVRITHKLTEMTKTLHVTKLHDLRQTFKELEKCCENSEEFLSIRLTTTLFVNYSF